MCGIQRMPHIQTWHSMNAKEDFIGIQTWHSMNANLNVGVQSMIVAWHSMNANSLANSLYTFELAFMECHV